MNLFQNKFALFRVIVLSEVDANRLNRRVCRDTATQVDKSSVSQQQRQFRVTRVTLLFPLFVNIARVYECRKYVVKRQKIVNELQGPNHDCQQE